MSEPARWGPFELLHQVESGPIFESFIALRRSPGGAEQRVWLERVADEASAELAGIALARAKAASTMSHPNVVRVVEHGTLEGSAFVASKLVDGIDLATMLRAMEARGERFDLAVAIAITADLARGLQHAHHARVVHGDLVASDVRIGFGGEVKLGGFAIAPVRAPAAASRGAADDMLALGIVAHQMLTGKRPFEGADGASAPHALEIVDSSGGATTMAFAGMVERLLDPDASRRVSSAGLLVAALGAFDRPEDLHRSLGSLVRRHMSTMIAPRIDAATLARLRTALGDGGSRGE